MTRKHLLPVLVALWLPLAGCGQKGPLYLPGDPSEIRRTVPTTSSSTVPEDAADDESDEATGEDREQR